MERCRSRTRLLCRSVSDFETSYNSTFLRSFLYSLDVNTITRVFVANKAILSSFWELMTNVLLFRRRVLLEEFISVPSKFIDLTLKSAGNFYSAYLALELAEYTYLDTHPRPYMTLKVGRRMKTDNAEAAGYGIPELKKEIQAARKQRTKQESRSMFLIVPNRISKFDKVHFN